MASPASTASQNIDPSSGDSSSPGPSVSPSAKAVGEVIAITMRDDFLLELSESLGGQASVRPVDSTVIALSHLAGSRKSHVLVFDTRDIADVRGEVEKAAAQASSATILVFASAENEKTVASALKNSNVFAVLPIPIDRRKTAAAFEAAITDAVAKRSSHRGPDPRAAEVRVETKADLGFSAEAARISISGPDEPPTPQISKTMWVSVAIAIIAVAVGGYYFMSKEESASPAVSGATPAARAPSVVKQAAPAADTGAPANSAVEVPLVKGRTDELLEKARLAMRERRYTQPANDSALLYYRSALAADPSNGEASDGMTRVGNLLITRFEESMTASRFDDASETLAAFKNAAPSDSRVADLEARLVQSQITKALNEGNMERGGLLLRQAQSANVIPAEQINKWRKEFTTRQEEGRAKRLVELATDRMRDGRLAEPADDSAKSYLAELKDIPGTNASAQRIQRELNEAYLRKAREANAANRTADVDRWLAEARSGGVGAAAIAAFQRDVQNAKQKAAAAEAERYAGLARERIRDGRLTDPANDSAMYYLTQVNSSDPTGSTATGVSRELSGKLLERAGAAARDGRTAQVDADLAAARRLGADPAEIGAIKTIVSTRSSTAAIVPRPQPQQGNKLKRLRYAPPEYPSKAFQQKLTGSVTVEFVVDVNGEPRDARVVDADPPEVFDKAALTAVKRWRYEPVVVNNVPTEVPTRMVIRFELPK